MAGIGLFVSIFYVYQRRGKIGIGNKVFIEYLISCTIFSLAGARVLFVIGMIPSMERVTINELLYYLWNGGIAFYGGLFGVILGIVAVSKKNHLDTGKILDFVSPAFPLFHAFARFGCLLAGCCYGVEWNWGVILADEPEIIRFPVQFFECICDIAIFAILVLLRAKRKTDKNSLALYLCSYACCRFMLEFYRGDDVRGIWGGLSTSQYISALIILFYGGCILAKLLSFKQTISKKK